MDRAASPIASEGRTSGSTSRARAHRLRARLPCDDMDSVMIQENVGSVAGTTHRTRTDELVHLIRAQGKSRSSATRSIGK
jgi:hypothetical protein